MFNDASKRKIEMEIEDEDGDGGGGVISGLKVSWEPKEKRERREKINVASERGLIGVT